MTSEAPKEIWIEDEFGEGHEDQWSYGSWDCRNVDGYVTSYTLTTHALAMVAAAYEDAANTCAENTWRHEGSDAYSRGLDRGALDQACSDAAAIRARTPADAQAALDALLREEREAGRLDGLREAAHVAYVTCAETRHVTLGAKAHDAILTLTEKESGQ